MRLIIAENYISFKSHLHLSSRTLNIPHLILIEIAHSQWIILKKHVVLFEDYMSVFGLSGHNPDWASVSLIC